MAAAFSGRSLHSTEMALLMATWRRVLCAIGLAGALLAGVPAAAQTAAPTQALSFGAFAAGAGGAVTVSPQGVRTASGDVTLMLGAQFEQGSSAVFDVSGEPNATYQILLPADQEVMLAGSRGGSMTLSSFTSSPSGQGQLGPLGSQTLRVGATLTVGSNQTPGAYAGSLNVTIVFQ